jgi:hypothetical protein
MIHWCQRVHRSSASAFESCVTLLSDQIKFVLWSAAFYLGVMASEAAPSSTVPAAPVTQPHAITFGEAAASANPDYIKAAEAVAPPLSEITPADAARIEAEAMKAHGGIIERGSFASRAMHAAAINARAAMAPSFATFATVSAEAGGDAAAARADHYEAVKAALKGTPYDLDTITRPNLQHLESVAAKAHGGAVEKGSYVAHAQVKYCIYCSALDLYSVLK